jgi:hypothetical protein
MALHLGRRRPAHRGRHERFYAIVTDLVGAPAELVKGKSLARDRRIAVCISHERQPYSFVAIEVRSQWPER